MEIVALLQVWFLDSRGSALLQEFFREMVKIKKFKSRKVVPLAKKKLNAHLNQITSTINGPAGLAAIPAAAVSGYRAHTFERNFWNFIQKTLVDIGKGNATMSEPVTATLMGHNAQQLLRTDDTHWGKKD